MNTKHTTMRCYDCGGCWVENNGTLNLEREDIGSYTVDNVKYYKCDKCGELLFPAPTLFAIEKKEREMVTNDILDNIKDLEPEFSKTVDENFWDLI
jgi:hypothetical protein